MNTHDIQRYAVSGDIAYPIHEDPEGDYVTYDDHVAAIEADRKRWGEPVLVGWAVGTTGGGLLHASKYTEYEARRAGYSLPLYRLTAPQPSEPYTSDYQQGHEAGWQDCRELYEPVLEDHRRLVRELDVLLNGEDGAAEQASLCDIVAQVRREGIKAAEPVGYFQNVNSLFPDAEPLYEQVAGEHAGDPDVFPLYAAPQPTEPTGDSLPRHVAQTLADAIYKAAQKIGIANGDHSTLSVPQCLHLLECMSQPAEPGGYVHTAPDDCETLHWRGQILSLNELATISAEPVKVPSDKDILRIWGNAPITGSKSGDALAFARALLARYGSTTDEATKQQRDIAE